MGTISCLKIFLFAVEPSTRVLVGEERKEGLLISRAAYRQGHRPWGQRDAFDLGKEVKGRVFLSLPPFSVPST